MKQTTITNIEKKQLLNAHARIKYKIRKKNKFIYLKTK